jgi:hypothetical protein
MSGRGRWIVRHGVLDFEWVGAVAELLNDLSIMRMASRMIIIIEKTGDFKQKFQSAVFSMRKSRN